MKRIVETTEESGLDALLGKRVLLMCANYFYEGVLHGVNDDCVELTDAGIVYETGAWSEPGWGDRQSVPMSPLHVQKAAIEAYGECGHDSQ